MFSISLIGNDGLMILISIMRMSNGHNNDTLVCNYI